MQQRLVVLSILAFSIVGRGAAALPPLEPLQRDIHQNIDARNQRATFEAYRKYVADALDRSTGGATFDDKSGNCRLRWIDYLLRHPVESLSASEEFTRVLHQNASADSGGIARVLAQAAQKLDVPEPKLQPATAAATPADPLNTLKNAIESAALHYAAALQPLSPEERGELSADIYRISTGDVPTGAFFAGRRLGRRVCDLAEKIDRAELHQAAQALVSLTEPALLRELGALPAPGPQTLAGVEGAIDGVVDTPCGKIVFGGSGNNVYHLDDMTGVTAVIDRGGDDKYVEGTTTTARPVLVVLDLAGNDTYQATKPGVQGAAVCGVSMLVDLAGNDTYRAEDVAQGAALAGIGILIDHAGDDSYFGIKRVQGSAIAGFGILMDRAGKDGYRCALYGQGVGGPLGFGLLDDLEGDDHYFAGGKFIDGYGDSPGYDAWSQGVGYGPRGSANGGIGVLLDGGGSDVYEYDYFSHGGGYWFAAGFARDFGGNDQYLGATSTMLDGSKRVEARFLRYGTGFGCHYALGMLIDDQGDDTYSGDMAGTGFCWDLSIGGLLDLAGNDRYTQIMGPSQGQAFQVGLAVLFDASGNDEYLAPSQASANAQPEYHHLPTGGGNFSFLIDYGGEDKYASGAANNAVTERGSPGGFLIDRQAP